MPFEWFVALRFLKEGRSQTLLIFVGVGVGVGVMIFLFALISGLQVSLIRQTLSTQAHVVVRPTERAPRVLPDQDDVVVGATVEKGQQRVARIDGWMPLRDAIAATTDVTAVAPTVAGSAFVHRGPLNAAVALRGIDPSSYGLIVPLQEKLTAARLELAGGDALIGVQLANDFGLRVGDKLRLQTTTGRQDVLRVGGIFDLGNKDVNQRWIFVSLREAQTLLDLAGSISTFEVRVKDPFDAESVATAVAQRTGLVAESWTQLN